MIKKIFIVSVIIFLMAGIYLFVQFFLFQKKVEKDLPYKNKIEVNSSILNKKDSVANGKIEKIFEEDEKSPSIDSSGNKILYFNQGNFLLSNLEGTVTSPISAYPFNELGGISWSLDNKKAIIKDSNDYYIFDVNKTEARIFKSNVDNLVWSKDGNQVIYKFYDKTTGKRSLNISDLSGANWKEIAEIPFQYAEIKVNPKNKTIALFSSPKASQETQLFIVDLLTQEKKEVIKKFKGANYQWSPNGEKLLFSYTKDNGKTSLAVLNVENENISELNFPGLVDKCIWSSDSISVYCANLTFNDTEAVFPDDWESGKISSSDTFWKIDTIKGEQERLIELNEINEDVDSISLFTDRDEKFLFFVDKKTSNLFRINLEK